VMESGLMNEIDEKYFGKSDIGEDSSAETSSSPLSLSFHSFSGLFFISGIAILLALLVSERFIWQRLILMAKALSERYVPISLSKETHPIHDSTNETEAFKTLTKIDSLLHIL